MLDLGFCVLKGLIELKEKGLAAVALIKKQWYRIKYIDGEVIKEHFLDKEVGDTDALLGSFENHQFHVLAMMEPDYAMMMMMSTYGTSSRVGRFTIRNLGNNQPRITCQYPEVIANHFSYRHIVRMITMPRRHAPTSLTVVQVTKSRPNRVFALLPAVTDINAMLCADHFYGREEQSTLDFRKEFSKALINNVYIREEQEKELRRSARNVGNGEHQLSSLPKNKKIKDAKMVTSPAV